ncbi:MAG: 2-C-methyl-D-erythritol 4-phosphate cytidylyltransferase [Deltaproteobacteria bacterium]|nr:MAG: 2-C-methyl-D-erythritol 4-phosphate cytidylyltransferase [Deltaproteobacteria bacterium]
MAVHVLVPAAGIGRRMGAAGNKQYLELGDRPILAHTLARLAALECVDALHVIVPEAERGYCREDVVARFGLTGITSIVAGGAERQDSVRNGLEACGAADDDLVLIHDGVRPFFPAAQIPVLLTAAAAQGAALLAIPAQDTVKEAVDGQVVRTLDRRRLWQAQTPQAFRYAVIRAAHRRALEAGFAGTDDASLVEWCGGPVAVVAGSPFNFKLTTPADLALARALLSAGILEDF